MSWCSQQSLFQFLTFNFTQVSATKLLSFKIYTHSINSSTFFSLLNAICFESLHFTGKFRQVPHMSVSLVIFVFLRLFAHWNEIVYTFSSVNLRFSDKYVTGSNQISPPPPFPVVKVYTHTRKRERQGLLVMTWVAPRRNEIVSCNVKKKTMTSCKKGKFDRFNSDNWSARTARLDLPAVETKHYVIEFLQKTFTARTFSKQTGWWIKTRKSSEAYDGNCLRRFATSIDHKSETVSVKFVNYKRFSPRVAYQRQDLSLDRKLSSGKSCRSISLDVIRPLELEFFFFSLQKKDVQETRFLLGAIRFYLGGRLYSSDQT